MSQITQDDIRLALSKIWHTKNPTAQKAYNRTKIIFEHAKVFGVNCDPFIVKAAAQMLGEVDHNVIHHAAAAWQDLPNIYQNLL